MFAKLFYLPSQKMFLGKLFQRWKKKTKNLWFLLSYEIKIEAQFFSKNGRIEKMAIYQPPLDQFDWKYFVNIKHFLYQIKSYLPNFKMGMTSLPTLYSWHNIYNSLKVCHQNTSHNFQW